MSKKNDNRSNNIVWKAISESLVIFFLATFIATSIVEVKRELKEKYKIEKEEKTLMIPIENIKVLKYRFKERYYTEVVFYAGLTDDKTEILYYGLNNRNHKITNYDINHNTINEITMDTGDDIYKTTDGYFLDSQELNELVENVSEISYEEICKIEKELKEENNEVYQTVINLKKQNQNVEELENYKKTNIITLLYVYNDKEYYEPVYQVLVKNDKTYYVGISNPNLISVKDSKEKFTTFIDVKGKIYEINKQNVLDLYYLNYEDMPENLTKEEIINVYNNQVYQKKYWRNYLRIIEYEFNNQLHRELFYHFHTTNEENITYWYLKSINNPNRIAKTIHDDSGELTFMHVEINENNQMHTSYDGYVPLSVCLRYFEPDKTIFTYEEVCEIEKELKFKINESIESISVKKLKR